MTHSRSHGAIRSRRTEAIAIELGNEPPLSVDGGNSDPVDRRRVSVQWLAGTILTALCGAALMGGAVFTSLDGQANFAALPERMEVALRGALGINADTAGTSHKSDRLPPLEAPSFSRQVIRISTIGRVGNHEVVRVRPFVRMGGNLALNVSDLTAHIPAFNPQRLLAESAPGGDANADQAPQAEPDAEVSFVMRDLPALLPRLKITLNTPPDEVMARVREAAAWSRKSTAHIANTASITGIKLAYAGVGNADPYAGFEARIVPENVTLLPKTDDKTTGGTSFDEKVIVAKKGDSVASVLRGLGATADDITAITRVLGDYGRADGIKPGQKLRILLSPMPNTKKLEPVRVIVADDTTIDAVAALSDAGQYVAVDPRNVDNEVTEVADNHDKEPGPGVSLYRSIYETALRNHVPQPIIDNLIRMYAFDVDFSRRAQPGDSLEVLYAGTEKAPTAERNDIVYAALTIGGETKKLYRFRTPDDGIIDYYDASGRSAKKFLVRKPVLHGRMTSGFGLRRHPLLGYVKMHTGVDWAAPIGTPIFAAGNGVIEHEGWESGYGKFILLRHANGYETAYGHMSAYARGTHVGGHVRQGQVIGFIGSTGLSTGPHLHFEIRINGRFVDPMRIKLPNGRELRGTVLTAFEQERHRLDSVMARKPARVASNAPLGE